MKLSIFTNKYRVIKDDYGKFESQIKYWWFPFEWSRWGGTNTHDTFSEALNYIKSHQKTRTTKKVYWQSNK